MQNALKHACPAGQNGGRRIVVGLGVDEDTRDTIISVEDNGRGIPPERLALVGAAGASTSGGGDGVAMVRRIIEGQHLGLVTFESEPCAGTTVRVRLPRRTEPALEPERPAAEPEAAAGPEQRLSPARIIAAVVVFLIVLATGICLAWYVA